MVGGILYLMAGLSVSQTICLSDHNYFSMQLHVLESASSNRFETLACMPLDLSILPKYRGHQKLLKIYNVLYLGQFW